MKNRKLLIRYLAADFIAANLAWLAFNILRYCTVAHINFDTLASFLRYENVVGGQIIIPLGWIILHYYSGYYNNTIIKSRLSEFFTTLLTCVIGCICIFFILLIGNLPEYVGVYYEQIIYLFIFSFGFTYFLRILITNYTAKKIHKGEWTVSALILGVGKKAQQTKALLEKQSDSMAYTVRGYIETDLDRENSVEKTPEIIGNIDNLGEIIKQTGAEELIVAIETDDDDRLTALLYSLYQYKLPIKLPLTRSRLLTGHIQIRALTGVPLIDISSNNYPEGEKNIKLSLDKIISLLVILILSPLYLYLAIKVKCDSPGPVFIRQERIGYLGKPFKILKFRTMRENAESKGPMLSSENDERITGFGHFMRKYRLDELPQFWNVLCGDMSLVGPRPERKYYIEQIVKKAPYFYLLHNVKPGISSLGMVKFGYARNIDEMIERMQYDILYYENMSLLMDLKILIYSIKTIYTGKGI
jgi:exopolysaccharide biosynthesis polyprenyl glycosylphosphotransferase